MTPIWLRHCLDVGKDGGNLVEALTILGGLFNQRKWKPFGSIEVIKVM